jgi:hypothetical protein
MSFLKKPKDGKVKEVLSGGWYEGGGRYREGVKEDEYCGNIMYSCMKMGK